MLGPASSGILPQLKGHVAFRTQPRAALSPPGKEMPGSSSSWGGGSATWLTYAPESPTGLGHVSATIPQGTKMGAQTPWRSMEGGKKEESHRGAPRLASGNPMTATSASSPSCPLSHRAPNPGVGTSETTANVGYLGGRRGFRPELVCVARAKAAALRASPAPPDLDHDMMGLPDRQQVFCLSACNLRLGPSSQPRANWSWP